MSSPSYDPNDARIIKRCPKSIQLDINDQLNEAKMDNLKNVSNKIKSVVGLRNARVNTDASGNLNESLLGEPQPGSASSTSAQQPGPPPAYSSTGATSVALDRQRSNNERFQEHLRQEEEQIYSEIRARKFIEEEDRKLAQLLQSEGGGRQMNVKGTLILRNQESRSYLLRSCCSFWDIWRECHSRGGKF